jgi:hypothetical protein
MFGVSVNNLLWADTASVNNLFLIYFPDPSKTRSDSSIKNAKP